MIASALTFMEGRSQGKSPSSLESSRRSAKNALKSAGVPTRKDQHESRVTWAEYLLMFPAPPLP